MSVSPTLPPSHEGFGARNMTKVDINFEIPIMDDDFFLQNMLKNTVIVTADSVNT